MFDDYPELKDLKDAAQLLAEYDRWDTLYDEPRLETNTVPVFAAGYIEDMYVDYDLARETARIVKGIKTFETNVSKCIALLFSSTPSIRCFLPWESLPHTLISNNDLWGKMSWDTRPE